MSGVFNALKFSLSLSMSITVTLCGCAASTGMSNRYPADWSPTLTTQGDECPNIAGVYENFGQFIFNPLDQEGYIRLSRFFSTISAETRDTSIQLTFNSTTKSLVALTIEKDGLVHQDMPTVQPNQVSCLGGAVWLPPSTISNFEVAAGYRTKSQIGLRVSRDGFLVAEDRQSSIGYVLIIPHAETQIFWYRWKRIVAKD